MGLASTGLRKITKLSHLTYPNRDQSLDEPSYQLRIPSIPKVRAVTFPRTFVGFVAPTVCAHGDSAIGERELKEEDRLDERDREGAQ